MRRAAAIRQSRAPLGLIMQTLTFATQLRQLREARGVSRRDLATRARLSEAYLEKVERGYNAPPSALAIMDLAKGLGADADELFALSGKVAPDLERLLCVSPQLVQVLRVASKWDAEALRDFLALAGVVPCESAGVASIRNDERIVGRDVVTAELRRAVFHLDGNECVYCSATNLLEVDHVQPVSLGGTNDLDNLVTACGRCNKKKGNRAAFVRVFGRFRGDLERGDS